MRVRRGVHFAVGTLAVLVGLAVGVGTGHDAYEASVPPPGLQVARDLAVRPKASSPSLGLATPEAASLVPQRSTRDLAFRPAARAGGEWTGMPAEDTTQVCPSAGWCGLALGCRQGRCAGCASDDECDVGEVCILNHCVLSSLATCRSRIDCSRGELCILSGLSAGPRGNSDMHAYCLAPTGPSRESPAPPPTPAGQPVLPEVHPMKLLSTFHQ